MRFGEAKSQPFWLGQKPLVCWAHEWCLELDEVEEDLVAACATGGCYFCNYLSILKPNDSESLPDEVIDYEKQDLDALNLRSVEQFKLVDGEAVLSHEGNEHDIAWYVENGIYRNDEATVFVAPAGLGKTKFAPGLLMKKLGCTSVTLVTERVNAINGAFDWYKAHKLAGINYIEKKAGGKKASWGDSKAAGHLYLYTTGAFLVNNVGKNLPAGTLLMLDEAHNLSLDTLNCIRSQTVAKEFVQVTASPIYKDIPASFITPLSSTIKLCRYVTVDRMMDELAKQERKSALFITSGLAKARDYATRCLVEHGYRTYVVARGVCEQVLLRGKLNLDLEALVEISKGDKIAIFATEVLQESVTLHVRVVADEGLRFRPSFDLTGLCATRNKNQVADWCLASEPPRCRPVLLHEIIQVAGRVGRTEFSEGGVALIGYAFPLHDPPVSAVLNCESGKFKQKQTGFISSQQVQALKELDAEWSKRGSILRSEKNAARIASMASQMISAGPFVNMQDYGTELDKHYNAEFIQEGSVLADTVSIPTISIDRLNGTRSAEPQPKQNAWLKPLFSVRSPTVAVIPKVAVNQWSAEEFHTGLELTSEAFSSYVVKLPGKERVEVNLEPRVVTVAKLKQSKSRKTRKEAGELMATKYCYAYMFPEEIREQVVSELGHLPLASSVLSKLQTEGVTSFKTLSLSAVRGGLAHISLRKDKPRPSFKAYFERFVSTHPSARLGLDLSDEGLSNLGLDESWLKLNLSERYDRYAEEFVDCTLEELVAGGDEGIEEPLGEERFVRGSGTCWQALCMMSFPKGVSVSRPASLLTVTAGQMAVCLKQEMEGGLMIFADLSLQTDGDYHIENPLCMAKPTHDAWKKAGKLHTRIGSRKSPLQMALTFISGGRKKLVGNLHEEATDHIRKAINSMSSGVNAEAIDSIKFKGIEASMKMGERICPWVVPDCNLLYLKNWGVPTMSEPTTDHPHPVHAAMRRYIHQVQLPKLLPDGGDVYWCRPEVVNRIQPAEQAAKYKCRNTILSLRDFARYKETEPMTDLMKTESERVFFSECAQFFTPSDVLAFHVGNPKVKVAYWCGIIPPESLVCDYSVRPTLYKFKVSGANIYYSPEDDEDDYEQPLAGNWWYVHNRIACGRFNVNVTKEWRKGPFVIFATSVDHEHQMFIENTRVFPDMGMIRFPEVLVGVDTKNVLVNSELVQSLYLYAEALKNPTLRDMKAQLRRWLPKRSLVGTPLHVSHLTCLLALYLVEASNNLDIESNFTGFWSRARQMLVRPVYDYTIGLCSTWQRQRFFSILHTWEHTLTVKLKPYYVDQVDWRPMPDGITPRSIDEAIFERYVGTNGKFANSFEEAHLHALIITLKKEEKRAIELERFEKERLRMHELRKAKISAPRYPAKMGNANKGVEIKSVERKGKAKYEITRMHVERVGRDAMTEALIKIEGPRPHDPLPHVSTKQVTQRHKLRQMIDFEDKAEEILSLGSPAGPVDPDIAELDNIWADLETEEEQAHWEYLPKPHPTEMLEMDKVDEGRYTLTAALGPQITGLKGPAAEVFAKENFRWENELEELAEVNRRLSEPPDSLDPFMSVPLTVTYKQLPSSVSGPPTLVKHVRFAGEEPLQLQPIAVFPELERSIEYQVGGSQPISGSSSTITENTALQIETPESLMIRHCGRLTRCPQHLLGADSYVNCRSGFQIAAGSQAHCHACEASDLLRIVPDDKPDDDGSGGKEFKILNTSRVFDNRTGQEAWVTGTFKVPLEQRWNPHLVNATSYPGGAFVMPQETCLLDVFKEITNENITSLWVMVCSHATRETVPEIKGQSPLLSKYTCEVLALCNRVNVLLLSDEEPQRLGIKDGPEVVITCFNNHFELGQELKKREPVLVDRGILLDEQSLDAVIATFDFQVYRPSASRATSYIRSLRAGTTGTLLRSVGELALKQWENAVEASENCERQLMLTMRAGNPGVGKSRGVVELLQPNSYWVSGCPVSISLPTAPLREDWALNLRIKERRGHKIKSTAVNTFENQLLKANPQILVVDEISKLPPGYVDAFILLHNSVKQVILLGDPEQTDFHEPNEQCALNDKMVHVPEAEWFAPFCESYLVGTWRLPQKVAAVLGLPSFGSDSVSDIKTTLLSKPGCPVVIPSRASANAINDHFSGGATTFSSSQGKDFDTDYVVVINMNYLRHPDTKALWTAVTRGKKNLHIMWDFQYSGANERAVRDNKLLHRLYLYTHGTSLENLPAFSLNDYNGKACAPLWNKRVLAQDVSKVTNHKLLFTGVFFIEDGLPVEKRFDVNSDEPKWLTQGGSRIRAETAYKGFKSRKGLIVENLDALAHAQIVEPVKVSEPVEPKLIFREPNIFRKGLRAERRDLAAMQKTLKSNELREIADPKRGLSTEFPAVSLTGLKPRLHVPNDVSLGDCKDPTVGDPQFTEHGHVMNQNDEVAAHAAVKKRLRFSDKNAKLKQSVDGATASQALYEAFVKMVPKLGQRKFDWASYDENLIKNEANRFNSKSASVVAGASDRASYFFGYAEVSDPERFIDIGFKNEYKCKPETLGGDAKPLQTIATVHDAIFHRMGGLIRTMADCLMAVLPENLYVHIGKSPKDLNDWCKRNWRWKKGESIDYTAFDQGQNVVVMNAILKVYKHMGAPERLLDDLRNWKMGLHSRYGEHDVQRFTGEAETLLGNTICGIMLASASYLMTGVSGPREPCCFVGDDASWGPDIRPNPLWDSIKHHFTFILKKETESPAVFVGWRLTPEGIYKDPRILWYKHRARIEMRTVSDSFLSYAYELGFSYRHPKLDEYLSEDDEMFHGALLKAYLTNRAFMANFSHLLTDEYSIDLTHEEQAPDERYSAETYFKWRMQAKSTAAMMRAGTRVLTWMTSHWTGEKARNYKESHVKAALKPLLLGTRN